MTDFPCRTDLPPIDEAVRAAEIEGGVFGCLARLRGRVGIRNIPHDPPRWGFWDPDRELFYGDWPYAPAPVAAAELPSTTIRVRHMPDGNLSSDFEETW